MTGVIEFVGSSERGLVKEEGGQEWTKGYDQNSTHDLENSMPFTSTLHAMTIDATWGSADHDQSLRASTSTSSAHAHVIEQGFTNLLLNASFDHRSLSPDNGGESNNHHGSGDDGSNGNDFYEDNKNYWNSIFNLVNYSSPSNSSMF
ncbi:hypothetical protein RJT34_10283 [Clitoria ternatea]|uniref:Uncharacterized protein n=1 Tax=Clitoria ternatea TaxID=43366 RepID=A0AAN9K5W9_CLITE